MLQKRLRNYLITLLLVLVAMLSIQFKWFFDEAIEHEKNAESRISSAVCNAFVTIASKDKMGGKSTQCANLGGGEFEIHTTTTLTSIDSAVKMELIRADKIVPFKITSASQAGSQALNLERGQITGRGDFYQMAHLDVSIPARSSFLANQVNEGVVLYFVLVSLIGVVFYNVFKSIREDSQTSDDTLDVEKGNTHLIGRYTFDSLNQVLRIGQTERRITKKENQVLNLLCSKKNQVVRRADILTELWGENDYFKGRSLDVFVARLRKYLSADKNIRIENIYGVGFILSDDWG